MLRVRTYVWGLLMVFFAVKETSIGFEKFGNWQNYMYIHGGFAVNALRHSTIIPIKKRRDYS